MKRELNIDNVVYFLNQLDYSVLNIKNNGSWRCVKLLVQYFLGEDYEKEYVKIDNNYKFYGTYIKLNENKTGQILNNVSSIDFVSLYPNILIKLIKNGKLKINIKEFVTIYEFLITKRFEIKQHPLLITDGYRMLKYIINATIGIIFSSNHFGDRSFLYVNDVGLITAHTDQVFSELIKDTENICYIDCDSIYVQNVTDDIINKIDTLNLPYDITNDISIYFHQIKRYVALIDGKVIIKGIQNKQLHGKFSEIVGELNILNRHRKIKKINKKIKGYVYQ